MSSMHAWGITAAFEQPCLISDETCSFRNENYPCCAMCWWYFLGSPYWGDCGNLMEFLQSLFLLSWDLCDSGLSHPVCSKVASSSSSVASFDPHSAWWTGWMSELLSWWQEGSRCSGHNSATVLPSSAGFELLKHSDIPNPFNLSHNDVDELTCERHHRHSPPPFFLTSDLTWPLV